MQLEQLALARRMIAQVADHVDALRGAKVVAKRLQSVQPH
jgi:hypothetical protein